MGTYGTFTGLVRFFDPVTRKGYLLSLQDGEVQASMIGEGITAADENILLDASGLTMHDMTKASIITPTFGVGLVQNVLPYSEAFNSWTAAGTGSATANTTIAPDGVTQVADTLNFPASGDGVTQGALASPTLANGQSAAFIVWLKAGSAGTVRLWATAGSGGASMGTLDCEVGTTWKRFALLFTNSTGSAQRVYVGIERHSAGQLATAYAWGAQVTYNVPGAIPYWPLAAATTGTGTVVLGHLYLTTGALLNIGIGMGWITAPTGNTNILIGLGAGDGISGNYNVVLGYGSGLGMTGSNNVALGNNVATSATGDACVLMGTNTGDSNSGANVIALGAGAGYGNTFNNVVLFGHGSLATAANQAVLGSSDYEFTNFFGGGGVVQATPPTFTINATGGLGTNVAGAALKLAGGKGTGTGAGGAVTIQTAPVGSTGDTPNVPVDRLTVDTAGNTKIGDGGSTNYAQFDTTGNLTFVGTAQAWDDIRIEPVARTTGSNAPTFEKWYDDAAGTSRGVYLYSFDDASAGSEKEVFFTLQMPHSWNSSDVHLHVHWIGAVADTTATPRWGLEYAWKEPGAAYGDTTIIYAVGNEQGDTDITAHKHYITEFAALSPGSTADGLSSILIGRLFRDSANAADTYNATGAKVGLLYIDGHFQIARIGSTDEYTP